MKSSWRQRLYQAGLVLGSVLLAYQAWTTYTALRQNTVRVAAPLLLVVAWGLIMVATGIQITAWSYLMRWLGVQLLWRQFMRGYMLPFLARYVPGSVWGYLSRSQWMWHNFNVPFSTSNIGSLLEVMSVLTAAGVIVSAYFMLTVGGLFRMGLFGLTLLLAPLCWLGLWSIGRGRLFNRLPVRRLFVNMISAMPFYRWMSSIGLHLLLWLCYGIAVWLTIDVFNASPRGGILAATFIFTVAWLVGFLFVFVPAGLGVRELTLSGLLVSSLGLPAGTASVIALVTRAFILLAEVAFIILGMAVNPEERTNDGAT